MKKLLLLSILSILSTAVLNAQDDFEGSLDSWQVGGPAQSQVTNPSGGPTGDYLQYVTTGNGGGAGSRMIVFNRDQWKTDLSVYESISFDANVLNSDLDFRIAVRGPGNTRISTTNAVAVTVSAGWTSVEIPILESDFTVISGSASIAQVLQQPEEMRILSSANAAYIGDVIDGTMQIDNVTGNITLSLDDSYNSVFSLGSNPVKDELRIILFNDAQSARLEVYDVLGKEILSADLDEMYSAIDINAWSAGIYLLRVSNGTAVQTKRLIKL
ncbi:MAG: T9SS type A sorting domain-containing protein [Flavobacteriaceae bacterium]|nr:T9SS type A sorting domain-containing protein [Flavobacteriaceae bacterium]